MAYTKGQSGNPKGKPVGSKDKRTELRQLLQPNAKKLVNKLVELALSGDMSAMKLCIDRIIPAYRPIDKPIHIEQFIGSPVEKMKAVNEAVSVGTISASEAHTLSNVVLSEIKIKEASELEDRLQRLEAKMNDGK
jgi:hypothetical protein